MAPEEIRFAENHEVESRRRAISQLLDHVLDPDDGEYWLSDVSTIFDVWEATGKEEGLLLLRIRHAYGVDLRPDQLAQPLWRLVDRLEGRA